MESALKSLAASNEPHDGEELRAAPRFTLLIRAVTLISPQGEFVCVIRDVSETGISVRLFHDLPACEEMLMQTPGGGYYKLKPIWSRRHEAGFEFVERIEVAQLINESSQYPKRGLRLNMMFLAMARTLDGTREVLVENLSQQGARFRCEERFAIDQSLRLSAQEGFRDIRAKVRWRRDVEYGVVFDDTFTLGDFARLAARLQAPTLLTD